MKRVGRKGEGRFERISWDEALADSPRGCRRSPRRAPEAILPYSYAGTMGLLQGDSMARRFFHKLGASLLDRTICATAGKAGWRDLSARRSAWTSSTSPRAKLILIWGSNSIASNLHFWTRAQEAKRRGAKLVASIRTAAQTAEKCHEHIALLPGTDAALALGLMHVLIAEEPARPRLHRPLHAGLRRAARARAELAAGARRGDLRHRREQVIVAWRATTARTKPAAIRLNYGMQRVRGGGNAVRAIACLPALVGAWRERAGGALLSSSGSSRSTTRRCERPDLMPGGRAAHDQHVTIGDALLRQGDAAFGPKSTRSSSTTPIRSRSRPSRRKSPPASRARTCSASCTSTSRPTPPTTPTSCCRRRRSSSTSTCTRRTATRTRWPTMPAIAPLGEAQPEHRGLSPARRAHGLRRAVLSESDDERRAGRVPRRRTRSTASTGRR